MVGFCARCSIGDGASLSRSRSKTTCLSSTIRPTATIASTAHGCVKIGRASCRERVCQYVSISVVAESLKKNRHRHTSQHSWARTCHEQYPSYPDISLQSTLCSTQQ